MTAEGGNRDWLNDWRCDYETLMVSKVYFLRDYCNLQESVWARHRRILADKWVERFFTSYCRAYPDASLYPDFEACVSRIRHFPLAEIKECLDTQKSIWLSAASTIFGVVAGYERHKDVLKKCEYVAVAAGSPFNSGYYGIHLCRVIQDDSNFFDHELARFYGGRVYENRAELDRIRLKGFGCC